MITDAMGQPVSRIYITCDAESHGGPAVLATLEFTHTGLPNAVWQVVETIAGPSQQQELSDDHPVPPLPGTHMFANPEPGYRSRFTGLCPFCGLTVPMRWERLNPILTEWSKAGYTELPLRVLATLGARRR